MCKGEKIKTVNTLKRYKESLKIIEQLKEKYKKTIIPNIPQKNKFIKTHCI